MSDALVFNYKTVMKPKKCKTLKTIQKVDFGFFCVIKSN